MDHDQELVPDRHNGLYAVVWSRDDGLAGVWFDWCAGNVYTADPDRRTLGKALQMARRLKARVLGDDATEFLTTGQELPIWNNP